jgi:hypothetical protein
MGYIGYIPDNWTFQSDQDGMRDISVHEEEINSIVQDTTKYDETNEIIGNGLVFDSLVARMEYNQKM